MMDIAHENGHKLENDEFSVMLLNPYHMSRVL
jgi:hypothetical protein